MQNELASIEQSTEFLCPNCGTSAFEVIGTQWGTTGGEEAESVEFLIMKCLDCLRLFRHRLQEEEFDSVPPSLQEM